MNRKYVYQILMSDEFIKSEEVLTTTSINKVKSLVKKISAYVGNKENYRVFDFTLSDTHIEIEKYDNIEDRWDWYMTLYTRSYVIANKEDVDGLFNDFVINLNTEYDYDY